MKPLALGAPVCLLGAALMLLARRQSRISNPIRFVLAACVGLIFLFYLVILLASYAS